MIRLDLKNRRRLGTTLGKELDKNFRELSEETRIPMTKLIDETIEDLLIKHGKIKNTLNK